MLSASGPSATDFSRWIAGAAGVGIVASSWLLTSPPDGGVPVAVAVLCTEPLAMSPAVTTYVWVGQVALAPTARLATQGTLLMESLASVIRTLVRGTLPVLVTTNV